jgi:hypothetical protein
MTGQRIWNKETKTMTHEKRETYLPVLNYKDELELKIDNKRKLVFVNRAVRERNKFQ